MPQQYDWYVLDIRSVALQRLPDGKNYSAMTEEELSLIHILTIFEALHLAGGVLVYGIPEFRLPKAIVQHEIENLKELGVDIQTDMVIGKVLTIDELFEMGYEAVFVGSGAGFPRFMNIPDVYKRQL